MSEGKYEQGAIGLDENSEAKGYLHGGLKRPTHVLALKGLPMNNLKPAGVPLNSMPGYLPVVSLTL